MFLESKNNLDSPNSAAFEAANRDTEIDEIILQVAKRNEGYKGPECFQLGLKTELSKSQK